MDGSGVAFAAPAPVLRPSICALAGGRGVFRPALAVEPGLARPSAHFPPHAARHAMPIAAALFSDLRGELLGRSAVLRRLAVRRGLLGTFVRDRRLSCLFRARSSSSLSISDRAAASASASASVSGSSTFSTSKTFSSTVSNSIAISGSAAGVSTACAGAAASNAVSISCSSPSSKGAGLEWLYLARDSPGSTAKSPERSDGAGVSYAGALAGAGSTRGGRETSEAYFDSGNPRPRFRRRDRRPRRSPRSPSPDGRSNDGALRGTACGAAAGEASPASIAFSSGS